jgi:hypothetical protein
VDARPSLTDRIDQLITLFNNRSEDLPDGMFDRRTQFSLNGVAFEAMLGRPASDPLVLMLARGAAGYRFAVKALWHAVPDARIERAAVEHDAESGTTRVACWLSGHLRDASEPADAALDAELKVTPAGVVERAGLTVDEQRLSKLREARRRP